MNNGLFEVRDLWLAAFAVANGLELKEAHRGPDGWTRFYFDEREIGPVYMAWTSEAAQVNPRKFIGAYKYVRTLVMQKAS